MAQALKATFFAFRKREKSGVLTKAAIGAGIGLIILSAAFLAAFASTVTALLQWCAAAVNAAATSNTSAMQSLGFPPGLGSFVLGLIVWMFGAFVLFAAFEAACLRWMIRGESGGGLLGLNFGADTWRVYSSYWIWFLLYMTFSMVLGMLTAMVMVPVVMGAVANGGTLDAVALQTHPAILALTLLQYGLLAYFGVRLAPAAAASVARKKFAFFDAWKITKGRFVPMFGSFFVLFFLYAIGNVIFYVAMFATVLSPMLPVLTHVGTDPAQIAQAEVQILQGYGDALSQPANWPIIGGLSVLITFVGIVFYIACYGVNARAALVALEEGKIAPPTA